MKSLVIYHANCLDGFTSAWACWLHFGDTAEYLPAQYGDDPPDVSGRHVTIVDFSYPRDALLLMYERSKSLGVYDHHKTAQADLAGLHFCVFDMDRSGAGLIWDHISSKPRPPLVSYVEDRDLWRFALPDSERVNAFIGTFEQTFAQWTALNQHLEEDFESCAVAGASVLRSTDRYVEQMKKQARSVRLGDVPFVVPCVNAPYIRTSELVGALAEDSGTYAAGWFQRADGKYQYSLRSRGDFDVSEVAKKFGGGGHKNAAGFVVAERVDNDCEESARRLF